MMELLADLVLQIRTVHPVRVGIDGPSAAGKTTLADSLATALRARTGRTVVRAEIDYFMLMVEDRTAYPYDSPESYYLDAWNYPAIRQHLLEPLGPGGTRRYRTALGAAEETAPDDAILLADGVFLQRPELDHLWDLRIYVDVPDAESLRRDLRMSRDMLQAHLSAADLARLDQLTSEEDPESVLHRTDAFMLRASTVHTGVQA
jgi:uridine kinase